MALGGVMGTNNRGTLPPAPVPAGPPTPPGPVTMMPNGNLGLTPLMTSTKLLHGRNWGKTTGILLHPTAQFLAWNLLYTNVTETK